MAETARNTIYAVSTAPGRAAIAVVRVSGPEASAALRALAGDRLPTPRQAALRTLRDGTGGWIDQALVLWFPAPASETGEDVVEFHLHGGRAITDATLAALAKVPGLRAAEPGEFTRRAVENGKLDLTRAEALADLIGAETPAQARQALRQYQGALADLYEGWRARLIALLAWAEAAIDFSDEELPDDIEDRLRAPIMELHGEMMHHLDDARRGEITREGLFLTVIGAPNAGKSSLVNALARRDVAIVSETPGTTRDIVETRLDLGGYVVHLADTAGLRDTGDVIEREGVRRALARAAASDMTLLVLDGTEAEPFAGVDEQAIARASVSVWNKCDLPWPEQRKGLRISARTGEGLDALLEILREQVRVRLERPRETPPMSRARHRECVTAGAEALARARNQRESELAAEDLRLALRAIGRLTGRVDIEELLDVVFRDFCIGK
ncbi:MAG TPA: tRNA uridine-5-carboxymethylaminomethyl(34) synthesis GTPase MnmE [Rhizomicrobium sp.]|jgi:tRNA modification GTPase|nr:tRNA uridine-5-carboxymethylaminomethyl(34) synthesis GTPase MnmE [Rhizomicrobium sp.]